VQKALAACSLDREESFEMGQKNVTSWEAEVTEERDLLITRVRQLRRPRTRMGKRVSEIQVGDASLRTRETPSLGNSSEASPGEEKNLR